jgi:hypothetical protein
MVDRPWFGESPADILNLFNSAFNFILNNCLAPSAFEFAESFPKPMRLPQAGYQKLRDICCPKVAKNLNSPVLKSF